MKLALAIVLFIYAHHSYSIEVNVHSLDERADLSKLDSLTYKKHQGLPQGPKNSALISIENQNKIFSQAKLEKEVKAFDQLDRDMLILIAKREKLETLSKKFPAIPKEKLRVLKALVGEKK